MYYFQVEAGVPVTNDTVAAYIHRLHRRSVPHWERYEWLQSDDRITTSSTDITTILPTDLPSEPSVTTAGPSTAVVVQKGAKKFVMTASSFLVILLSMIVGNTIVQLANVAN